MKWVKLTRDGKFFSFDETKKLNLTNWTLTLGPIRFWLWMTDWSSGNRSMGEWIREFKLTTSVILGRFNPSFVLSLRYYHGPKEEERK